MSEGNKLVNLFAGEGAICGDLGCEPMGEAPAARIRTILPGATIGVLGGGQLGRMLAHSGNRLGYRFVTLDPTPDSPCGQTAAQIIIVGDDLGSRCRGVGLTWFYALSTNAVLSPPFSCADYYPFVYHQQSIKGGNA